MIIITVVIINAALLVFNWCLPVCEQWNERKCVCACACVCVFSYMRERVMVIVLFSVLPVKRLTPVLVLTAGV